MENFEQELKNIVFPNYKKFSDINSAYCDLVNKITQVINNLTPYKTIRVKNQSNEWFDGELAEQISNRNKLYKKFKKSLILIQCKNSISHLILKKYLFILPVSGNAISDFLKELKINLATGIDNFYGHFLKDSSKILATPIVQICNLSIKTSTVHDECKIAKLKPLYEKGKKTILKTTDQFLYFQLFPKSLKKSSMIKL